MYRIPYVIAEIGNNHQGRPDLARALIDVAKHARCDAVKLQMRDVLVDPPCEWAMRQYSGNHSFGVTYLEHRRALELPLDDVRELVGYARSQDIAIGASVWDPIAAASAFSLGLDFIKIPSACLSSRSLYEAMRAWRGWTIISTGMHTESEISEHVQRYNVLLPGKKTVLHCVSQYPLENADVHLAYMLRLREILPTHIDVGISGHWRGVQIDVAAMILGASVIERHITLDRTMKGTDHAASLEPAGLQKLVRDLEACWQAWGSRDARRDKIPECELASRAKLLRV